MLRRARACIAVYDADVMCLQEVDLKFFQRYLRHLLPELGLTAVCQLKVCAPGGALTVRASW